MSKIIRSGGITAKDWIANADEKEIANVIGISEGTSKSNYAKAKKKLKTILSNRFNL